MIEADGAGSRTLDTAHQEKSRWTTSRPTTSSLAWHAG